jgi:hypothetical protein
MPAPRVLPTPAEVVREALTVIGGAVLAALVIGYFPEVKAWVKARWQ